MPSSDQSPPAGGIAPGRPRTARDNRSLPARPVTGPSGHTSDAIADFLAYLLKQHEAAAVIFPGTPAAFENQTSPRS